MADSDHPSPVAPLRPEFPGPLPPAQPVTEELGYRPLSLLAIASFGVAVLYAAFVLLPGLVAFFKGTPWLMPGWSVVLPVVAVGLALVARLQIQRSEGTLGGDKLVRSALTLSIVLGLCYWAYYAATYLVIRQQAEDYASKFLEKLARGEIESAFLMTRPPQERVPEGPDLRNTLEFRFNTVTESTPKGLLSMFHQSEWVRLMSQGGPPPQIEPRGLAYWDYEEGGYRARVIFKITTAQGSFDIQVAVHGTEDRERPSEGRQWSVLLQQTRHMPPVKTPEGERVMVLTNQAGSAVQKWLAAIANGRGGDAYLATRLPAEREPLRTGYGAQLVAHGLALGAGPGGALPGPALLQATLIAAGDSELGRYLFLPGYYGFTRGDLVQASDDFWAPDPKMRDRGIGLVKEMFEEPGMRLFQALQPEQSPTLIPLTRSSGDRFQVEFDFQMIFTEEKYLIDGRIVMESDGSEEAKTKAAVWRVAAVKLLRARELANLAAPGAGTLPMGGPNPVFRSPSGGR